MTLLRLLSAAALAVAVSANRVALEPAPVEPVSWNLKALPPVDANMTVYMLMRHESADVEVLRETLMAVSDPRSSRYGQHLSLEEVGELAPISDTKVNAVRRFLETAPDAVRVELNPNNDILTATMTVRSAEALFETKISIFTHKDVEGASLMRASTAYTVPEDVAEAVTVVADLIALPRLNVPRATTLQGSSATWDGGCKECSSSFVTPKIIKEAYSVPDGVEGSSKTSMAVAEFQGQYFKPTDLTKFNEICNVNVKVSNIVGGNKDSAGIEAELDIEYIGAIAPKVPLTVVYAEEYSLTDWVQKISAIKSPPLVNSVSYGNDEKQQTSRAFMEAANTQFMKAGARGISILFASGDQGVCGREGCGVLKKRFKPDFPAGSPYITAVGGTDFAEAGVVGEETAWSAGGGGFSDTFPIPDYQKSAVEAYKKSGVDLPAASLWNNTGRGYPDIAALGGQKNSYCVVTSGSAQGVAGTSASCPTASAIFALLNDQRADANASPLGFLNPFIYQNAAAFNDVTTGSNACCGLLKKVGFTATKGWDPTTGHGTPNYAKLVVAMKALPQ